MRLPFSFKTRAEPPESPQTENAPVPSWLSPDGLTAVHPSGASYRENRIADNIGVDPWVTRTLQGLADGGMNYGPPPNPEYKSFEIPRIFRRAVLGWAGLQQMGYVQDQRGGAQGYGVHIPHVPFRYAGRGFRSISMARQPSPRPFASDRVHVPAIFVPTAPIA